MKKITAAEIKKMIKLGNLVVGTKRVIKNLKLGKVQSVLMSSNCPTDVEKNINYYAELSSTVVHKLDYSNEELSVMCKKPFSISVLALPKGVTK